MVKSYGDKYDVINFDKSTNHEYDKGNTTNINDPFIIMNSFLSKSSIQETPKNINNTFVYISSNNSDFYHSSRDQSKLSEENIFRNSTDESPKKSKFTDQEIKIRQKEEDKLKLDFNSYSNTHNNSNRNFKDNRDIVETTNVSEYISLLKNLDISNTNSSFSVPDSAYITEKTNTTKNNVFFNDRKPRDVDNLLKEKNISKNITPDFIYNDYINSTDEILDYSNAYLNESKQAELDFMFSENKPQNLSILYNISAELKEFSKSTKPVQINGTNLYYLGKTDNTSEFIHEKSNMYLRNNIYFEVPVKNHTHIDSILASTMLSIPQNQSEESGPARMIRAARSRQRKSKQFDRSHEMEIDGGGCVEFDPFADDILSFHEAQLRHLASQLEKGHTRGHKWRRKVNTVETYVTITVKDINDNAPMFPNSTMYGEVQENGPIGEFYLKIY